MRLIAAAAVAVAAAALIYGSGPADLSSLKGKRVVVTGASKGIGRDVALQFAAAGAHVVACARDKAALDDVAAAAASLPGTVTAVKADLSTGDGVEAFWGAATTAQSASDGGGGAQDQTGDAPDIVVLNHVIGFYDDVLDKASGASIRLLLERLLAVNTVAYAQLAMMALETAERAGAAAPAIVVVSSAAGRVGLPRVAPYSASKHALHGFFNSLRHDLVRRGSNATVTTVVLGNIDTESNRAATAGKLSPSVKRYQVRDAAAAVVRASVERPREVAYPWGEIAPLVTLHALFPTAMDAVIRLIVEP